MTSPSRNGSSRGHPRAAGHRHDREVGAQLLGTPAHALQAAAAMPPRKV
ncbi:MAG TPA: hypothetical protein VMI56_08665 [Reyranella sp.]|nr:hypothetical protein [Reyranella sp.]